MKKPLKSLLIVFVFITGLVMLIFLFRRDSHAKLLENGKTFMNENARYIDSIRHFLDTVKSISGCEKTYITLSWRNKYVDIECLNSSTSSFIRILNRPRFFDDSSIGNNGGASLVVTKTEITFYNLFNSYDFKEFFISYSDSSQNLKQNDRYLNQYLVIQPDQISKHDSICIVLNPHWVLLGRPEKF